MNTLPIDRLIDLAAMPDPEWRMMCSAMNWYLMHPEKKEDHEIVLFFFGQGMRPDAETWDAIREEVNMVRLRVEEQKHEGQVLSRKEYMRLYMRRRRLGL